MTKYTHTDDLGRRLTRLDPPRVANKETYNWRTDDNQYVNEYSERVLRVRAINDQG